MKQYFYRYFGPLFSRQEEWLNRMASRGLRCIKAGQLRYTFEPCAPGAYQYRVEFSAHRSAGASRDYKEFLESCGYRVMYKNLNLNFSLGKIRFRPYGQGMGKIATSPGAYGRELLLVERRAEGTPFVLHTTYQDRAAYCRPIRNMWLSLSVFLCLLAGWLFWQEGVLQAETAVWAAAGLALLAPAYLCQREIWENQRLSRIEE